MCSNSTSTANIQKARALTSAMPMQLSEKWKEELVATGELDLMINKWLSRATLDVIGEGV